MSPLSFLVIFYFRHFPHSAFLPSSCPPCCLHWCGCCGCLLSWTWCSQISLCPKLLPYFPSIFRLAVEINSTAPPDLTLFNVTFDPVVDYLCVEDSNEIPPLPSSCSLSLSFLLGPQCKLAYVSLLDAPCSKAHRTPFRAIGDAPKPEPWSRSPFQVA